MSKFITFKAGKDILKEFMKQGKDSLIGKSVDLVGESEVDLTNSDRPFGKIKDIEDDYVIVLHYDWLSFDALVSTIIQQYLN